MIVSNAEMLEGRNGIEGQNPQLAFSKILKIFKLRKKILFNKIYLGIFYIIIGIMTILIIIGLPWVNPLFKYPNQLKNIIEWNFFLLAVIYYLPLAFLFNRLKK